MKVCVLTGKEKLEWVERDIPQREGGIADQAETCGVCGSDLHFYKKDVLQTGNLTDRWHWDMNPEDCISHR